MRKWVATIHKEWLLLIRDRTGLLLLFLMPAALVVVITLVQDNILRQTGGLRIRGALVDADGGAAAQVLVHALEANETVTFRRVWDGQAVDVQKAADMVAQGELQFYAAIPAELTAAVAERVRGRMERLVAGESEAAAPGPDLPEVAVYFDPTIQSIYRTAVNGVLHQALAVMQAEYSMKYLGDSLERHLRERVAAMAGGFAPQITEQLVPTLGGDIMQAPVVRISVQSTGSAKFERLPTAVQQNVPAWALFGMFFIVVPLSGSLIRERREGILARLLVMPVSRTALILGKLTAYAGVCMIQFLCIVLVGKWLLPLLGTDAFVIGGHAREMLVVALCSALAATGYGILLGVVARTNEQAAVLGPVSIVIAAALGGIMVPVFAMPHAMQVISQASPLAWAHDAFMTLLVRDGGLSAVWLQLTLLLLFFGAALGVSLFVLSKRRW